MVTVTDTSYGPLSLEIGETYYWRVDEVNEPEIWQGDIWHFTTFEYFVIDDMEDYKIDIDKSAQGINIDVTTYF